MRCPACGGESTLTGTRCSACGASRELALATGVLTPVPGVDAPTIAIPSSPPFGGHPSVGPRPSVERSGPASINGMLARGQTLGSRYHIIRRIGEGGMGCVYEAWDAELGVVVALKVIKPEIASDPQAAADLERRFKRELLLARQVTHKNVVRIHDLGTIDGMKYITMSYVDGVNLASVLSRDGKLPVPRALRIARGIVAGLSAAHQAGVVHRDLKPPNVMIDAHDEALIMDFGVARSASPDTTMSGDLLPTRLEAASLTQPGHVRFEQQTTVGTVIGTIEYMAPEQARGEAVDHRADIYAFGLILYDMLAGNRRTAYTGGSIAELADRMAKPPTSLRSLDSTIPPSLEAIITRCLAPDAAARYQTTGELAAALERLDANGNPLPVLRRFTTSQLAAASVLVLSLLGGTWWFARGPAPVVQHELVTVLIADFNNRANDPVFDGALEQAFNIALEGAPFITAYPRRDAQRIVEQLSPGGRLDETAARLVSAREGIKVVLAGSIDRDAAGYRITVRAIDPARDEPLAVETVHTPDKSKVLAAIGSLAAEIRGVLGDTTPQSARLAAAETFTATSLEAVRAYSRGQELHKSGKPREALAAFEEAVRLDPEFGRAYVNMAGIYTNLKMEDRAKANYELALQHLDRMTDREKYRTLGIYYLGVARNYEQAIQNYETLVRLYPSDNMGHANLALAYLYVGNVERAVEVGRKASEIYPKNLLRRTNYATYAMYSGDFATAIAEAQHVLKEQPSYEWAHQTLALSKLAQGDVQGAREAYGRLASVSPLGRSLAAMGQADLEMYMGRPKAALTILQAGAADDTKAESWSNLAHKYVAMAEAHWALGERRQAVAIAEKAIGISNHEGVLFPVARVLILAGELDKAEAIAATMDGVIQPQVRSYGRLVHGAVALQRKRYAEAIDAFRAALKLQSSWTSHRLLAEVYTAAGQMPDALAEWELCVKRRGEVTDAFFADTATLRYLPAVHYWLGRAQEALGARDGARRNFDDFLKLRAAADPRDPLATDAASRLQALTPTP